ncbi:phytanoyl-CoA dioxygenase, peroxisomal isoform X3 [Plutella xylostella]|uniref:phytanoyl-CoA dioxygenase, peroxisomal isoform X3 n=1 Tax=Plutella xylostella TaxID=51655 RepID=UPI002032E547|nr:phytanoyl-CoA dioxygenase, peroxisomal isoform X3 [Plutella xylostella]
MECPARRGVLPSIGVSAAVLPRQRLPRTEGTHRRAHPGALQIQDVLYDPVLYSYSSHPRLVSAVSSLLGDNLTAMNSMLINKPPRTACHPPHQDQYYLPIRPSDKILGSWTAIDRVDRENGCLYLVPRSHRAGELYEHGYPPNAKGSTNLLFHGIHRDVAPLHSRLYLTMEPGDTVLFHSLLVHGSEPNVSQRYRKALSTHFASSECRFVDTRGTPQQVLTDEVEELFRKRGVDFKYTELFQHKCRQIKGVKCNL